MLKVEITSKEMIKPSSPTPLHLRIHKLSWIDRSIRCDHIPFILFYPNPNASSIPTLKTSLSHALSFYYPFAGEINADRTFVDCNDRGAYLLLAVADSDAPLSQFIDSHPDQDALNSLLPCGNDSCRKRSGYPLLSIQITTFSSGGGMAIGACLGHQIADGHSAAAFIASWASTATAGGGVGDDDQVPRPMSSAASVFAPPPDESYAPKLSGSVSVAVNLPPITKRFLFEEPTISSLKSSSPVAKLTRVEAVTAFLWRRLLGSRGANRQGKPSVALIAMNVRGKTVPPLPDNLFGNLVYKAAVAMTEPTKADAPRFEEKVRMGIKNIDWQRLRRFQSEEGFSLQQETISEAQKECIGASDGDADFDTYWFTSWTRFSFGEADFGWGKPAWVGIGDRITAKNLVILMQRTGGGGIEAWVTLEEKDMMRFECDEEIVSNALPI